MTELIIPIAASGDDGFANPTSGTSFYSGEEYLIFQRDSESNATSAVFLRFANVTIPQGSVITSAHLDYAYYGRSGSNYCDLAACQADDYVAPTTAAEFRAQDWTGGGYSLRYWYTDSWPPGFSSGTVYQSPDFASVIQEIVDRDGWESGNAIGLRLFPQYQANMYFRLSSFDHPTHTAPQLHIIYESAGVTPNPLKLYLHDNGEGWQPAASWYVPATKRGSWDASSSTITCPMGLEPTGYAPDSASVDTSTGADQDTLAFRASYILRDDTYFSGAVSGVLGIQQAGDYDAHLHIHAFVTQGKSDSLRGTLIDNHIDTDEASTDPATCGEGFSDTLTDCAAFAGDVLVIEVGCRTQSAGTVNHFYNGGYEGDLANDGNAGNGDQKAGWIQFAVAAPAAPSDPTLTSPVGAESWREGSTQDLTYTKADPEQSQGYAVAYELEFSALGTFADAVDIVSGETDGSYSWTLPDTLVAADTDTCKVRIRAYVAGSPAVVSSWDTSDAFTIGNSTAPTVTLIDPEDDELFQGELDLKPTFTFGTADTESDPVHVEFVVSYAADYSDPIIDTDSATDYADWEESASPFTTWTTMGSGGATAGNRIRYKPSAQLRYDYCYGKVRLKDAYSTAVFTEFEFTIVVDPDLHLSVTIGGVPYNVGACHIVENTGGEPSPITLQIDLDQYADEPLTDTATVSIASGLGNHNRVWNGTLEPWSMEGVVVNCTVVQDDFYLSHLDVPDDYVSADLGAQFAAIIGDCGEGKLTASHVDTTTGVSAAISGKYRYIREVLQQILAACPAYLGWVDAGADVWLIDQADLPAATICLYEEDPTGAAVTIPGGLTGVRILPGASVQIGTLDRANRVRCIVRNSSPLVVATATNTTVAPTFATSPRTHVMYLESGDATFAAAVAAAQLAFLQETRYVLNGIPVRLEDGLGIRLGTAVHIIIPRCGIDTTAGDPYPVRHVEHDFGSAESVIDVGEYAAPRDDPEFLFAVAASLDQLRKETAIT